MVVKQLLLLKTAMQLVICLDIHLFFVQGIVLMFYSSFIHHVRYRLMIFGGKMRIPEHLEEETGQVLDVELRSQCRMVAVLQVQEEVEGRLRVAQRTFLPPKMESGKRLWETFRYFIPILL